jgi:crotonobetainyl-CoA:carnitine CoA-transferase CaiB-like acyl-CoA transferase
LPEFASLASDNRFATIEDRQEHDAELTAQLNSIFPGKPTQEWLKSLASKNLSAIENIAPADFRNDPHVREAGLVVTRDHPGRGSADHVGVAPKLSKTPVRLGVPAPLLGADTKEILQEAGYTGEQIDSLMSAGVVATERS